jgi:PAS domain S-box-containing protein
MRRAKQSRARAKRPPTSGPRRRRMPVPDGEPERRLAEAVAQHEATAEVLGLISGAPPDLQRVFDTIADRAMRLCGAQHGAVFTFDGTLLHLQAHVHVAPDVADALTRLYPMPPGRGTTSGRAILTRAVVHVPDIEADPDDVVREVKTAGFRSALAVPMLRGGEAIGAVVVLGSAPVPFSDQQVGLLQTFAAQAVIAIENVRLFQELEARNRDLTEALDRQTATSEVLKVISRSAFDLQPVLETVIENATRLCGASRGHIFRSDGDALRFAAADGAVPGFIEYLERHLIRPGTGSAAGRAALERRTVHVPDVLAEPGYEYGDLREQQQYRAVLAVPMVRGEALLGVVTILRDEPEPFTRKQIELVTTFADQAVIAIENVRLFSELQARNAALAESLQQQTATAEILRVMSSSPTDVQPVFETIARSAAALCDAVVGGIWRVEGERLHVGAFHNVGGKAIEAFLATFPMRLTPRGYISRAVIEGRPVHIDDAASDPGYGFSDLQKTVGYRTFLAVPMLREENAVGVIGVWRHDVRPFSEAQVALLQTFAHQAVIAIENVRLFSELDSRTRELTRSVDELTALSEVSRAVSSTLDLETVLSTIVSRAVDLSAAHGGLIYEYDEATETFTIRGSHGLDPELGDVIRASPIRVGEGVAGQAAARRVPVQVPDVLDAALYGLPRVRAVFARLGYRALLGVPLLVEERIVGVLNVWRREPGLFGPDVVRLLQTFAAQSVLAIQNARLFRETQRQKQYSEGLVETSPVAIVTVDLRGTVVGWNPGAERLFGYRPAEAIGRAMEELIAVPDVREEVRANVRRTLAGEWIRTIGRRARKEGTAVDVEISSVPVILDGATVGMIAIYHDITELLQARRDAEAANAAKSAFLATMSHEIRTPMNAVIGMSGLLLSTDLTEEQREFAEVIRQSGDALLTVINDILDFSKIEAGKLELESQPFDLRECVEGAVDLVATRAAEKGLDLACVFDEHAPVGLVGDVTRLRQVLLNLLSNAVKFTERGEVVLSVTGRPVAGAAGLHEVTFAVRDTGIGIPVDRLGRLFQSFSQVDASTTRRYGGTGLGLAISQRLTELMGSRITVTSEVGIGSEFAFTLRAQAAAVLATPRRELAGMQPALAGKRVLVVDDNATNRRILGAHLAAWGMQPRVAASPAEALEWVQAGQRFDIGVLDMHMPEMDGIALGQALREELGAETPPLILFTSLGRREARAEREGFAAYLNKPIKPSQLFDALVSVLPDQPAHLPRREAVRSQLDPEMARRHPLRILLAEDNVVNQKLALRLLAQMGYRADLAANGLEAIAAVERQPYDVILMDVQMPELDGLEASREITGRWPRERRPRIVAMTANAMQGDRELCEAAGMDDYVTKPIRVEELVAALERGAARRDATADARAVMDAAADTGETGAEGSARGPAPPPVDPAVHEGLVTTMGDAFVAELTATFVDDGRELIATLRRSLAANDVAGFRRAAHSLKSNGETLGARRLAAQARDLEALARAERLAEVGDRLEPLLREYERVADALRELSHGRRL